jgi:hypothetical protein
MVYAVSTYSAIFDENFNCTKCKKRFNQQYRDRAKGCATELSKPIGDWKKIISYTMCPANFYQGGHAKWIDLFRQYERGLLPFTGGIADQPNKAIELFNLIESLVIENRIEIQERMKKNVRNSNGLSGPRNKRS